MSGAQLYPPAFNWPIACFQHVPGLRPLCKNAIEIVAPMGVSSDYNVGCYRPDMDSYMLFNNMEEDEEHYSA